jgi:hypothetical protein
MTKKIAWERVRQGDPKWAGYARMVQEPYDVGMSNSESGLRQRFCPMHQTLPCAPGTLTMVPRILPKTVSVRHFDLRTQQEPAMLAKPQTDSIPRLHTPQLVSLQAVCPMHRRAGGGGVIWQAERRQG